MPRLLAKLSVAAVVLVSPQVARAWGPEGHRIIAHLAYERLTPGARAAVGALIAHAADQDTPTCPVASLEDAATWPDCVRPLHARFDYLAVMHYEDMPICGARPQLLTIAIGKDGAVTANGRPVPAADAADPMILMDSQAPYCRNGKCLVVETRRAEATLKDLRRTPVERLQALEEVTHFIGDLHQPLHAADNNDRGGNSIQVFVGGHASNLHHVWDTEILENAVGADEAAAEAELAPLVARNASTWSAGDLDDWLMQSHRLAVAYVYPKLNQPPACGQTAPPQAISQAYLDGAGPLVREQLAKAAVRLARVLNTTLG